MRRMMHICLALLVLLALALPVRAATEASSVTSYATVAADGSCQISLTVTLRLEQAVEEMYFPVPAEASAVMLNGARVSAPKNGAVRQVNLSKAVRNVVGDVTVNVQFSLHDVIVTTQEETIQMQLPMLSGFAYPVQRMEFSVTLPAAVEQLPGFYSGYHQNRIEEDLLYEVNGPTISGSTIRALKDHETLTMTLSLSEEMFPQAIIELIFGLTQNKILILIIINLFLFVVGMIVNDTTGMLICAPLLLPLMKELGISNVHFAAIMGVNLAMGGVTPPYASILYLGMRIGECEFKDIFGPTMKLLIFGYVPVVFLTTYIPALSEWLPSLMGLM